jgi:hypothetical protein
MQEKSAPNYKLFFDAAATRDPHIICGYAFASEDSGVWGGRSFA